MTIARFLSVNRAAPSRARRARTPFPVYSIREPAAVRTRTVLLRCFLHAKSSRQSSVCAAAVPDGAGVYGCCGADAGFGDRRNDRDIHVDSRRDAAFAAGFRSWEALPGGGRGRLLRGRGSTGQMGDVFVRSIRAAEGADAGIRGSGGLPGRAVADGSAAAGRGVVCQTFALRVRERQLFLGAGSAGVWRTGVYTRGRHASFSTGGSAEPPGMADDVWRRSDGGGVYVCG